MKLSVVIPAFNEERDLGACLDHLLAQTRPIDEIIVVDNNSTDRTGEVAAEYAKKSPAVRVVTELQPGVAKARDAGFNSATGDIIGRIDADSKARCDWASVVVEFFSDEANADWDVIGGFYLLTDVPGVEKVEAKLRKMAAESESGGRETTAVSGTCFAMRRACWEAIRGSLLSDRPKIHEDHDMSAAVRQAGRRLWLDYSLVVDSSPRRYLVAPWRNIPYALGGARTAWVRRDWKVFAQQGLIVAPVGYAYLWVLWVRYRGWDPDTRAWSFSRLFSGRPEDRVTPVIG
ncbi:MULTISPECIES: glycosyltransferase [Gordonia]|uniref:glycosyltransferase n=1 Tax=Gordonia TaxID=2053 RepID=UPI0009DDDC55|nr:MULTISPECIES: glycosyltransferase [Gordonia]ASR04559.1 putative glycosyltransferase EpsJ [Gordonia rubripertincta]